MLTAISVTLFLSFFTKMFWKLGSKNKRGRVCFWRLNQCRCILSKVVCFRVVWCCQDEGWKKKTEKFQKQRRRSLFVRGRNKWGPVYVFLMAITLPHLFLKNTHSKCTWQLKTWRNEGVRANSCVFSFLCHLIWNALAYISRLTAYLIYLRSSCIYFIHFLLENRGIQNQIWLHPFSRANFRLCSFLKGSNTKPKQKLLLLDLRLFLQVVPFFIFFVKLCQSFQKWLALATRSKKMSS